MLNKSVLIGLFLSMMVLFAAPAGAEDDAASAAQANNPLANFTAVNFHNYYIGDLSGRADNADQFWLRFAKPFSVGGTDWIFRGSLPFSSFPTSPGNDYATGLGDLNMFAAYKIDVGNPAVTFGAGPQLTVPTATDTALGSEKWSAGLVNVLFDATSKVFQYGYLLTWQHSFAGEDDRNDVNLATMQPFAFYQLGGGTYLRSTGTCSYDIKGGNYVVPVGLGIGQVIKSEKVVYNLFLEPQLSVVTHGANQPKWQVFTGINLQF